MMGPSRSQGEPQCKSAPVRVIVVDDIEIPVGQERIVGGRVESSILSGECLFCPFITGLNKRELIAAYALVNASCSTIPIRLMNTGDKDKKIYKNTHVGYIEQVNSQPQPIFHLRNLSSNEASELVDAFFKSEFESLLPHEATTLKKLLAEFIDIFSKNKMDIGCVENVFHHIDTGNAAPIACLPRRIPIGVEGKVDELVEELLKNNIIQPSDSPWNSPIVVVRKKDGDIRLCVDFRRLNAVTSRPIFPIPATQHLFDTLEGSGYFSSLDLSQGYHQIPVAKCDIPKTAFTTRKGQFEYLRMPMGLCSAPGSFQKVMHSVLRNENWEKCLVYLDDILIFGRTMEEHNDRLATVLTRIRDSGLKLSPSKCHFAKKEVEYLGHVISSAGIKTSQRKIDKVKNWPSPNNETELRSFLGLCGYYRRFIKNYSSIVAPLEKLCTTPNNKKCKANFSKSQWIWNSHHEESFLHLKYCLTHAPILAYPCKIGRFILDTDACHESIGAVLSQMQNGEEKVIAYASHKLSKSERAYCITRKELLSVYKYVLLFKHYLYGRQFTVRTDHQALTWMLNWKKPNTSQYCTWIAELECYDFEIIHREGKLHGNADALSRVPQCQQCDIKHADPKQRRNIKTLDCEEENNARSAERILCKISTSSVKWNKEADEDINVILKLLRDGKVDQVYPKELNGSSQSAHFLWNKRDRLRIRGSLLHLVNDKDEYALVIPHSQRQWLVRTTHEALGHPGVTKTLSTLKGSYYWPGMEQTTRLVVNTCKGCAQRKTGNAGLQPPAQTITTGFPFQKICIDITGPLPPCRSGERFILGIIDCFSKYSALIPLKSTDSKTVAGALMAKWICIFGAPLSIHSDRGSNFESELFLELCKIFRIKKTRTSPYYPQSDGMIERLFRTAKDMLYATVKTFKREWKDVLPIVEMGLRSTIHCSTKVSPFEIVFGGKMRIPNSWLYFSCGSMKDETANDNRPAISQYIIDLQNKLHWLHSRLAKSYQRKKVKPQVRGGAMRCPFEIGQKVMAKIFPEVKGANYPRYDGPYIIKGKLGDWTYELEHSNTKNIIVRNHHHIKHTSVSTDHRANSNRSLVENQHHSHRNRLPVDRYGFL
jgi:transposase InsO family protein